MAALGDIGGEIVLRLTPEGGRIGKVEIVSTRPRDAARVFVGKPVAEMTERIGRVFSLCGTAQTVAALAAAEAVLGVAPAAPVAAARALAGLAERWTQAMMRLALHWPEALGLGLRPALVREALALEARIEGEVLGGDWRRPGAGLLAEGTGLEAAIRQATAAEGVAALAADLEAALLARGLSGFGALPEGVAPEQGTFARHWAAPAVARARAEHGAGLAARLAAAREELATLPGLMLAALDRVGPAAPREGQRATGTATAEVETARGPLVHSLALDEGRVAACRLVAPTEANFTPEGAVVAGLVGAPLDMVAARLHVLAVDPCVAARLEVRDA